MNRYGCAVRSRWLIAVTREMQVLAGEIAQADGERARHAVLAAHARVPEPRTPLEECLLEHFVRKATLAALPSNARAIVELLTTTTTPRGTLISASLVRARRLLETRFREPWTVERLATQIGCHRSVLTRQFRSEYGTSVRAFLTAQRLRAAALLLAGEQAKVEAVSMVVGYRSKKNFYAEFRRSTGTTPAQFRSRCRTGIAGDATSSPA